MLLLLGSRTQQVTIVSCAGWGIHERSLRVITLLQGYWWGSLSLRAKALLLLRSKAWLFFRTKRLLCLRAKSMFYLRAKTLLFLRAKTFLFLRAKTSLFLRAKTSLVLRVKIALLACHGMELLHALVSVHRPSRAGARPRTWHLCFLCFCFYWHP